MGLKGTDDFRQCAMRIALTSGLTRRQWAGDLGVGLSTPNGWVAAHRDTSVGSGFVEEHSCSFPANRLWYVVGVSPRGLRAFRSRPVRTIAPNLLDHDFTADGPHRKWAGDIAAHCTAGRWCSNRVKRDPAIGVLKMATALRQPPKDCPYCSHDHFTSGKQSTGLFSDPPHLLQNHQG